MNRVIKSIVTAACVAGAFVSQAIAEPLKIAYSDWPGWLTLDVAKEKG